LKHFLLLVFALLPMLSEAAYVRQRAVTTELNLSPFGSRVTMGTMLMDKTVHVLRGQWDFASQGGAVSTIALSDIDGKRAVLLPGAIIKNCVILVDSPLKSLGSAQIALSSGKLLNDILPPTAYSTYGTGDVVAGCQVQGSSPGSWVKLPGNYTAEYTPGYTSAYTPTMSISGAAITSGKIRVLLEYILSR
jgi:hypothetical protein